MRSRLRLVATYLIHQFGTGYAVAVYIAVSAVITLAACAALTDHSRSDIADDRIAHWHRR